MKRIVEKLEKSVGESDNFVGPSQGEGDRSSRFGKHFFPFSRTRHPSRRPSCAIHPLPFYLPATYSTLTRQLSPATAQIGIFSSSQVPQISSTVSCNYALVIFWYKERKTSLDNTSQKISPVISCSLATSRKNRVFIRLPNSYRTFATVNVLPFRSGILSIIMFNVRINIHKSTLFITAIFTVIFL